MAWGPPLECTQHDDSTNGKRECKGPVEFRIGLPGGSGKSLPWCEFHWERALRTGETGEPWDYDY